MYRPKATGEMIVNTEAVFLMKNDAEIDHEEAPKKVVHFNDQNVGHIELRDLKEKDFLDLIDSKN
jgi:hypothetical protein